jgi:hypothetical protein
MAKSRVNNGRTPRRRNLTRIDISEPAPPSPEILREILEAANSVGPTMGPGSGAWIDAAAEEYDDDEIDLDEEEWDGQPHSEYDFSDDIDEEKKVIPVGSIEVREIICKRKNSLYIVSQFEEYKVFEALDGEIFNSLSAAKKYNKNLSRKIDFDKMFSEEKGNLRAGEEKLAKVLSSPKSELVDYFWIFVEEKEKKYFENFISTHYLVPKKDVFGETEKFKVYDKWIFFVVSKNIKKKQISVDMTDKESIKKQISELKSFLPENTVSTIQKVDTSKKKKNRLEEEAEKGFNKIDLD